MKQMTFSSLFPRAQSKVRAFGTHSSKFAYDIGGLYSKNYNKLPLLPLPALRETLLSYRRSIVQLASTHEQVEATDRALSDFLSSTGSQLQNDLVAIEAETARRGQYPHSYIEKYWDDMYLGGRLPTPINSNPFALIKKDPMLTDQIKRAADFVNKTVKFWLKVIRGELEADIDPQSMQPLCMYQFSNMLGTTRMPGENKDSYKVNPFSEHIVVACKGAYFSLKVIHEGMPINTKQLEYELNHIKTLVNKSAFEEYDVGYITTLSRDKVFELRKELINMSNVNQASIEVIDKCLFVLTLDSNKESEIRVLSQIGFTGIDGGSRWFDKHNVVVDERAEVLCNYDHSTGDGITWNRWKTEVWANENGLIGGKYPYAPLIQDDVSVQSSLSTKLGFEFNDQIKNESTIAKEKFKRKISNMDYLVLDYDTYGRTKPKSWQVSPDAVIQLAMQLGYHYSTQSNEDNYSVRGIPMYEVASMRSYFHGRTEGVRVCSTESVKMCQQFLSVTSTTDSKRAAFIEACKVHSKLLKGAKSCSTKYMGFDRHLFALKSLAIEQGKDINDIPFFSDPMFHRSFTRLISSSNITTPCFEIFGWLGPTAPEGFGIGYQILSNRFVLSFVSRKDTQSIPTSNYSENIVRALDEINSVMCD